MRIGGVEVLLEEGVDEDRDREVRPLCGKRRGSGQLYEWAHLGVESEPQFFVICNSNL